MGGGIGGGMAGGMAGAMGGAMGGAISVTSPNPSPIRGSGGWGASSDDGAATGAGAGARSDAGARVGSGGAGGRAKTTTAWQSAAGNPARQSVLDQILRLLQAAGAGGDGGSSGGLAGAAAGAERNVKIRNTLIRLAERMEACLYTRAASEEECTCGTATCIPNPRIRMKRRTTLFVLCRHYVVRVVASPSCT